MRLLINLLLVWPLMVTAGEKFSEKADRVLDNWKDSRNTLQHPFRLLLWSYQKGLSPLDGPTCPLHPTCAGYCNLAIQKHGPLKGVLLTGDRLLRCNPSVEKLYPRLQANGKYFDPVPP